MIIRTRKYIRSIRSMSLSSLIARKTSIYQVAQIFSGTYGGSNGSTYYLRQTGSTNIHQLGRTIWWLGLMRDRQPMQRGTTFPIIGSNQLKPAFDANDPPCPSGQC